jgi:hypothetical protein
MKDLITRKYNVIDEIATLMGKSLTSEHRQKLCDYMDEYADKQPTYEKMKERYNYEQSKNIVITNPELGETTGVYVFYDCGAGGNFVAAILDMIRNPNRKTRIDSETGHCHVEKLFMEGITNNDVTLTAISPSNFMLHPIDYDFYIIAAHLLKHNVNINPKSIFTHTKIIRVYTEPENFSIIAKNIFAKLLITQYDDCMTPDIYSEDLYNPGWEEYPEHRWLEVLYKKTLIELGYSTVIDPRSINIETYNKILHNILLNANCCIRKIPEQENMLQINMKDLVTRKYNVIDEMATFMNKSLTSEQRQMLCDYMDEYADKQPTYEKMKERYDYEQSRIG